MKKTISILVFIILALGLTGCASTPISDEFDEGRLISYGNEVIKLLLMEDYTAVEAKFNEEMKAATDAKGLEEALGAKIQAIGDFEKNINEYTAGGKHPDTDANLATFVQTNEYTGGNIMFTITFDTDYNICGLYMK